MREGCFLVTAIQQSFKGKGKEEFASFTEKLCRARLENLDCFLYGELVGELTPVGEVPMVDVKWEYKDVGEFKATPNGETHSVALPPRSVMARIDGQW